MAKEKGERTALVSLMISLQWQSECHDGLKTHVYIYVCT